MGILPFAGTMQAASCPLHNKNDKTPKPQTFGHPAITMLCKPLPDAPVARRRWTRRRCRCCLRWWSCCTTTASMRRGSSRARCALPLRHCCCRTAPPAQATRLARPFWTHSSRATAPSSQVRLGAASQAHSLPARFRSMRWAKSMRVMRCHTLSQSTGLLLRSLWHALKRLTAS